MMIGRSIFPPPLDVWAANQTATIGNTTGAANKSRPLLATSDEGFASGVANVTAANHNYVLNALTAQAILMRDQMLLPRHEAITYVQATYDNGFALPVGVSNSAVFAFKQVAVDAYRHVSIESDLISGTTFVRYAISLPSDDLYAMLDSGIPTSVANSKNTHLVVDDETKDCYLINPVGAARAQWGETTMSALHTDFRATAAYGQEMFCAHGGTLLRAFISVSGDTRTLHVYRSTTKGGSRSNDIVLGSYNNTIEAEKNSLEPIYLEWTAASQTRAASYVLITRSGAIFASGNGLVWTSKGSGFLSYPAICGNNGMLCSAAVVGDTVLAIVPYADTAGGSRKSVIYMSDDWFGNKRTYPTQYVAMKQMSRRLHYYGPATGGGGTLDRIATESPLFPFGNYGIDGSISMAAGWAVSQELTDPGQMEPIPDLIPPLITT
jgi:hypothetical protein